MKVKGLLKRIGFVQWTFAAVFRIKDKLERYRHYLCVKRNVKRIHSDEHRKIAVIYRWRSHCGIFSHLIQMMPSIGWAAENNMIPVIDLRTPDNVYKPKGDINWWDLFFEQPGGLSLDNISGKDDVKVLDSEKALDYNFQFDNRMDFCKAPERLKGLRDIYRNYIHLNDVTIKHIDSIWEALCPDHMEHSYLGVRLRGTGYRVVHPEGLSVVTTNDEMYDLCKHIKLIMREYHFDKIFLATDDIDILDDFFETFHEDLIFLNENDRIGEQDVMEKVCKEGKWHAQPVAQIEKIDDMYQHNLNYITEIMLLGKCDGIISNKCSASMILPLIKEDWKYEKYT